jgi:Family of unknown function (DUF6524)
VATTTHFDYRSFVARLLFSGFLVFATYNPSGYSYVHWISAWSLDQWEIKVLAGLVLFGVLAYLYQTAISALKPSRALYIVIACVSASLVLAQAGLIDLSLWSTWINIALATAVVVLTIGMSISLLSHRIAGIYHTEEVARF